MTNFNAWWKINLNNALRSRIIRKSELGMEDNALARNYGITLTELFKILPPGDFYATE